MVQPTALSFARRRWGSTDLLMLAVVLIWGINFTVVKVALRTISPMTFNTLRFSLATLLMVVILRLRGESFALSRRDVLGMIVLGVIGHTLYQWFFIRGIARTTPGATSLLMGTSPIFVALYGHLLGTERANRVIFGGIALSFAGVVLLILGGTGGIDLASGAVVGDLMVLLSGILWAAYTTLSKPLLRRYSAIKLTTMAMVAGIPPLILMSVPELVRQDWGAVPLDHWLGVLYSGLFSVVVAYTLWSTGVQRVGSARTAIYSNVTPIVAIVVAWLALGDRLSLLQGLGAVIVLAGLLLTRQGKLAGQVAE